MSKSEVFLIGKGSCAVDLLTGEKSEIPDPGRRLFGLCSMRNYIFVVGGTGHFTTLKYDVCRRKEWEQLRNVRLPD